MFTRAAENLIQNEDLVIFDGSKLDNFLCLLEEETENSPDFVPLLSCLRILTNNPEKAFELF